eukprot:PLAT13571.1.p1 GENE.PLAT13571.1~~PLAT13571.1.p1  ORF type:complete len:563 (+),score=211.01 PLAT13571.1:156-1691(+)
MSEDTRGTWLSSISNLRAVVTGVREKLPGLPPRPELPELPELGELALPEIKLPQVRLPSLEDLSLVLSGEVKASEELSSVERRWLDSIGHWAGARLVAEAASDLAACWTFLAENGGARPLSFTQIRRFAEAHADERSELAKALQALADDGVPLPCVISADRVDELVRDAVLADAVYHTKEESLREEFCSVLPSCDMLQLRVESDATGQAFAVALAEDTLYVVVRGTDSIAAVLRDLGLRRRELVSGLHCHSAIAAAGQAMAEYIQEQLPHWLCGVGDALLDDGDDISAEEAVATALGGSRPGERPLRRVHLVGHSLGAGIAALAAMTLNASLPLLVTSTGSPDLQVTASCFATPACVERRLSLLLDTQAYITTLILRADLVPRLSATSLLALHRSIIAELPFEEQMPEEYVEEPVSDEEVDEDSVAEAAERAAAEELRDALAGMDRPLLPPGQIYWMEAVGEDGLACVAEDAEAFARLRVAPDMLTSHRMSSYLSALRHLQEEYVRKRLIE